MRPSVLIPTYQRPGMIDRCLEHLVQHVESGDFEVLVGVDGATSRPPDPTVPEPLRARTRVLRLPRLGIIGVRRALLEQAEGDIALWINDDALARPGLLDAHIAMHGRPTPRVVAGAMMWTPIPEPNLFDQLVHSTGLVFFPQDSHEKNEPTRIDYRNCFGLNMSFPLDLARRAGGVPAIDEVYGYDDIELAHRLAARGAEIWRCPEAVVEHDHRMTPIEVHRREYLLGRTAWHYAGANPAFAAELFGRDIRSDAELAYAAEYVARARRDAQRLEASFLALAEHPVGSASDRLLPVLSEHWTMLKRFLWRWGLLDAARGVPARWSTLASAPDPVDATRNPE